MEMTNAAITASQPAVTMGELASLCQQRAAMYALLGRLYNNEVGDDFWKELLQMRLPVSTGNPKADEGYRLIATYLCNAHSASLNELRVDYTRCFIGEGMSTFSAAYPYESVHTSEKRMLMQEARDEVMHIMRSEGMEKREGYTETEDHITAEMEFMQVLAERTAAALDGGDEAEAIALLKTQRNFFEDHLYSWVPLLTAEVAKFAQTAFYQGVAKLTDGFFAAEHDFLESVLEEDASGE